jgi:hypothetical protein
LWWLVVTRCFCAHHLLLLCRCYASSACELQSRGTPATGGGLSVGSHHPCGDFLTPGASSARASQVRCGKEGEEGAGGQLGCQTPTLATCFNTSQVVRQSMWGIHWGQRYRQSKSRLGRLGHLSVCKCVSALAACGHAFTSHTHLHNYLSLFTRQPQ